ncbi:MAG: hypothetical protein SPL15_07460 [Lachnospiraceae bacterium]|nr:hypothetical protein [Lachnospiraceae bacterium]MDY5742811.1 hypothetical protein [Lachnospiraceae bacterium]
MAGIGICLADLAFAERLSRSLGIEGYEITLYRSEEELLHELSVQLDGMTVPTGRGWERLPVELVIVERLLPDRPGVAQLCLTEQPMAESGDVNDAVPKNYRCLWRYSGRRELLAVIRQLIRPARSVSAGISRSGSVWLIHSDSGRCLKTTLAYLIGQLLQADGGSLVIGSGFEQKGNERLTELCYRLRHGLNWENELTDMLEGEGGQMYLKSHRNMDLYTGLTTDEWERLGHAVTAAGYRHLIIDAGQSRRLVKSWQSLATGVIRPELGSAELERLKQDETVGLSDTPVIHRVDISRLATVFDSLQDVWGCVDERLLQQLRDILLADREKME